MSAQAKATHLALKDLFGFLLLARVGAAVGRFVVVLGSALTVAAALGFVVLRFGR